MTSLQSPMSSERRAAIRGMLVAGAAADAGRETTVAALRAGAPASPARRRGTRRLGLAVAFTAAVTVTASVLLAADPDAPPSYAGWTAVPEAAPPVTASAEEIENWASKCSDLGVGAVGVEGVPARRADAAHREVLVDRRGGLTYCVDVSVGSGTPTDPLIALSGIRTERHGGLNSMSATVYDKPFAAPQGNEVLVLGGDLETSPAPDPEDAGVVRLDAYQIYGLSGSGVTGVDLVLTNGLRVTATVHDGIWGAWWPGDRGEPARGVLEVRGTAGTRTVDPAAVGLRFE